MMVVDTSALSHAFRRRDGAPEHAVAARLRRAIRDDEPCAVPGIVLQELLSGTRDARAFERLSSDLAAFPILLADARDHRRAARIATDARRAGLAVATIDCLIAAQTLERDAHLLTTDADFERLGAIVGLQLEPY